LEQIINHVPGIQVGSYVENRGIDLYRLAKEKGLEGIIAERKTGTYRPGKRSPDWLKIKARPQQEFVVCGFTEGKGSRKHLGALLLDAYRNGRLRSKRHKRSISCPKTILITERNHADQREKILAKFFDV